MVVVQPPVSPHTDHLNNCKETGGPKMSLTLSSSDLAVQMMECLPNSMGKDSVSYHYKSWRTEVELCLGQCK